MTYRSSPGAMYAVIEIPDDIPPGLVVGRGGQQCKQLQAEHGVRCRVDFDEHQVSIEGTEDGVNDATRDIHELFDKFRAAKARNARKKALMVKIYKVAVIVPSGVTDWQFIRRDNASAASDEDLERFPYQLVSMEPFGTPTEAHDNGKEADDVPSNGWLYVFNKPFRDQMVEDIATLSVEDPSSLTIKFAFGLQCFGLRNPRVSSGEPLSWEHLQNLELFKHIKPRWSNIFDPQSAQLMGLLNELETQFTEETMFTTELVVYVYQQDGMHQDISFKFQWESGEWRLVKRKPVRIVHAYYNIVLHSTLAVRARVCSREDPPASLQYQELVEGLQITMGSSEDPFTTAVSTGSDFPSDYSIRRVRVRETATVHRRGLRFKLSYMDTNRQLVSVSCHLSKDEDEKLARTEVLEMLVSRVLALIQ